MGLAHDAAAGVGELIGRAILRSFFCSTSPGCGCRSLCSPRGCADRRAIQVTAKSKSRVVPIVPAVAQRSRIMWAMPVPAKRAVAVVRGAPRAAQRRSVRRQCRGAQADWAARLLTPHSLRTARDHLLRSPDLRSCKSCLAASLSSPQIYTAVLCRACSVYRPRIREHI